MSAPGPNIVERSCLAAKLGDEAALRELYKLGADFGAAMGVTSATPLLIATQNGHGECIRILHECGADVNAAISHGITPVLTAARDGHGECIRILHECGADVNTADRNGTTPVYMAALKGHGKCIRILYECGADVNTANSYGLTPFYTAALSGHGECIRILHECGADVNTADTANSDGLTPVYMAAHNGYGECIRILHECGADVNTADPDGLTPVYMAALSGRGECVDLLVRVGADIGFMVARRSDIHDEIVAPIVDRYRTYPGYEEAQQQQLFSLVQLVTTVHAPDALDEARLRLESMFARYLSPTPLWGADNLVPCEYGGRRRLLLVWGQVVTMLSKRLADQDQSVLDSKACEILDLFQRGGALRDLLSLRLTCRCCEFERRFPVPYRRRGPGPAISTLEVGLIESFVGGDIAYYVPTGALNAALQQYSST